LGLLNQVPKNGVVGSCPPLAENVALRQKEGAEFVVQLTEENIQSKGQNSKDFGFRSLSVPAAFGTLTADIFVSKDLHRLDFRERRPGALPLHIDVVIALVARKNESVSLIHDSS
jgi:hypothetical protein